MTRGHETKRGRSRLPPNLLAGVQGGEGHVAPFEDYVTLNIALDTHELLILQIAAKSKSWLLSCLWDTAFTLSTTIYVTESQSVRGWVNVLLSLSTPYYFLS